MEIMQARGGGPNCEVRDDFLEPDPFKLSPEWRGSSR